MCTLLISYLLAKMTTLFIEGTFFPNAVVSSEAPSLLSDVVGAVEETKVDLSVIIKRNFFDANETVATPPANNNDQSTNQVENTTSQITNEEAVQTSLDIKLLSTISVGDGTTKQSSCVIGSGKKTDTYYIGSKDSFAANTQLTKILADRVLFLNNGRLEYVLLEDFAKTVDMSKKPDKFPTKDIKTIDVSQEDKTSSVSQEGDVIKIARSELEKALEDRTKLLSQARITIYYEDDKPAGFKMESVLRGSIFDKLGLRKGDVLKTINGKTFELSTGIELFNSLKDQSDFVLELKRRGEDKTFKYQVY